MKSLTTDNLLTISEIAEECDLVAIVDTFRNTKEKDAEKAGLQVLVKVLAGISKRARTQFYSLLGELTGKDAETVKNQSVKVTVDEIKAIFAYGDNADLIKDFFG